MIRLIIRFFTSIFRRLRGEAGVDSPAPVDITAGTNATGTFNDLARKRRIPFRIYSPEGLSQPAPVVLFSPGLGGSRDAAPYLGQALAKAGYIGIFLQHPGSDSSLLKGAADGAEVRQRLRAVTSDPASAAARYGDIPFVVDQIERMAVEGRFAGKIDPTRIGIAGHSYGARTVLTAAGQRAGGWGNRFQEPRITAGMAISPISQGMAMQNPAAAYGAIKIPLFHVTGTKDGMPLDESGDFDPRQRTMPFRLIPNPDQYLLVLDGADHNVFAARKPENRTPESDRFLSVVARGAVLFFDAYLKQDPQAMQLLREGFRTVLAPGDTFETK